MTYTPPFQITGRIVHLVADIAMLVERYAIQMERTDSVLLRKINRMRSIHGSLAIEGNSLSESEVLALINGKKVIAPSRDVQEVQNAIDTYDLAAQLNPFDMSDMLKAHQTMMNALCDDAGSFRTSNEGVFSASGCVHLAPPPHLVHALMQDLFDWLKQSQDHPLISSCVFHYEFEFIHPFSDGNGRMGRLWQSLILRQWNPIFTHLPIENLVYANQQAYYKAIADSTQASECSPFIDFMLQGILEAIKAHQELSVTSTTLDVTDKVTDVTDKVTDIQQQILLAIRQDPHITQSAIAERVGISRVHVSRNMRILQTMGILRRVGSDRAGYWQII